MAFDPYTLEEAKNAWRSSTRMGSPDTWTTLFGSDAQLQDPLLRPRTLGFLKFNTFVKWAIKTTEGSHAMGVDCSTPSKSADREIRLRKAFFQFFDGMIGLIGKREEKPKRHEEYDKVANARGLKKGTFVLFQEFYHFLNSPERVKMCTQFRCEEIKEMSTLGYDTDEDEDEPTTKSATPAAPAANTSAANTSAVPAPQSAPTPIPKPKPIPSNVVDMDSSSDDEVNVRTPAPAPAAPKAKPTRKATPAPEATAARSPQPKNTLHYVLGDFRMAKQHAGANDLVFDATSRCVFKTRGDFTTVVKRRAGGHTAGAWDAYVYLSGVVKKKTRKGVLRSEPDILRFFNLHADFNAAM